jgi:hypothetical protein
VREARLNGRGSNKKSENGVLTSVNIDARRYIRACYFGKRDVRRTQNTPVPDYSSTGPSGTRGVLSYNPSTDRNGNFGARDGI